MPGTQEKDSLTARLPRPPRRIRRRRGRLSILILGRVLTAPFVAVAAALAIYVLCDAAVMFLFPAEPAQIVDLWRDFKPHRGTQFYVKYRTTGTGFTGTDNALLQEFLGFHIGQPVKAHVFYFGRNNGYSLLDRSTLHYARYRMITWFCASLWAPSAGSFSTASGSCPGAHAGSPDGAKQPLARSPKRKSSTPTADFSTAPSPINSR